jgi:hypothetical protein
VDSRPTSHRWKIGLCIENSWSNDRSIVACEVLVSASIFMLRLERGILSPGILTGTLELGRIGRTLGGEDKFPESVEHLGVPRRREKTIEKITWDRPEANPSIK